MTAPSGTVAEGRQSGPPASGTDTGATRHTRPRGETEVRI